MKNNIYNTLSGFASHITSAGRVLSVIFLLALSSSAWATTYYLYGGTSNNPASWSRLGSCVDCMSFEITNATMLEADEDRYVGVSSNSTQYWAHLASQCWYGDGTKPEGSVISNVSSQEYNVPDEEAGGKHNCTHHFAKYRLSASASKVSLHLSYTGTTKTCNEETEVNVFTYEFSAETPSYKLCGGFTDWSTSEAPEMTETGTAGVYSTSVYLPGGHTYAKQSSDGFKVAAVTSSGSATWYGVDATITSAAKSQTFASTDAGSSAGNRCGITTLYSGTYTFTYNSSEKTMTVTYPDAIEATPIVRWGALPTQTKNDTYSSVGCDRNDVNVSAYIASPGCSGGSEQTLSKLRVRLRKKELGAYTETEVVEFSGSYTRNNTYELTVPCTTELLMTCLTSTTVVMDIAGYNSAMGWSAYSDEMEISYTACAKFILTNLTKTFTACDGGHQFTLRDMVKPTPTGWSATLGGSDATSDFTLKDGQMIWNGTDKVDGTYTYTFTFTREGFNGEGKPNTAEITIKYDKTAPTGSVTEINITPDPKGTEGTPVTPWTPLTLTATYTGELADLAWTVSGVPAPIFEVSSSKPATTATFTSKPFALPVTYTVTVKGLSENCQATDAEHSSSVNVYTKADDGSGSTIILNGDAPIVEDGPEVTLNGYVKQLKDGNATLKKAGFAYIKSADGSCGTVTSDWSKVEYTPDVALKQGESWSLTINSGLKENTAYIYRAYAVNTYPDPDETTYSTNPNNSAEAACGTFTTGGGCELPTGDTIYYTIDASLVSESPCHLSFKSFENALANLKSHKVAGSADYWWDNSKMMLVKNVVFQVVPNKAGYGVKNGRLDLKDINKYENSSSPTPTKRLVIRPKVAGTRPIIWGMYLANSRWVTVNSMNIQRVAPSSSDGRGHSCVLIGLDDETNNLAVGKMTSTNLVFVNCVFSGDNFCCIHASAVDGLYLENNNLIAECGDASANTRDWGASIKFMNCKNITLLRNNFKGAHSNNIFSQNTRNLLVMNNVFWNDNKKFDSGTNRSAIIRLLNYNANDAAHDVREIGIYYNTLYLAKNDANSEKVDFLIFGGQNGAWNTAARYVESTIEFKYNNCYSYSTTSAGRSSNPFLSKDIDAYMKYNNFWSARDEDGYRGDEFKFGSNVQKVDMSTTGGMICSTAPNTPEGMVIKGTSLNLGSAISSDASGQGAESVVSDRLDVEIRKNVLAGNWTYGAYQSRSGETVKVIIWNGGSTGAESDWDNRNNWVKENGRQLTCVDNLSTDVKAIIPEPHSHQYPLPASGSITVYPTIPTWATPANSEKVRAGISSSTLSSVTKFAHTIEMEYGSAIAGAEKLKDGSGYHYHNVQSHLTVDPKEWVLVGSVVSPFKDKDKAMAETPSLPGDTVTRLTQSGDFYLYHKPHVYMEQFTISGGSSSVDVTWGVPFTALDEDVYPTQTFAISVADQFGDMKLPASFYYAIIEPDASKLSDGDKQRTFDFNGRYYAEHGMPAYTLSGGTLGVYNNAYPANIDGGKSYSNFNLYSYDYKDKAWEAMSTIEDKMIKPQSGFAIYNTSGSPLTFSPTYITAVSDGKDIDTKYKNAAADAYIVIRAYNMFNDKGSRIGVGEAFNDAYKLFNGSVSENLEVYMLKGDEKFSTLKADDFDAVIPVGVRNKSNGAYPIRFELIKAEGVESVILEDRGVTPAATYDLLSGETPAFPSIEPVDLEGRFYLVLGAATEEEQDIPTDAPAESADKFSVDVFVNSGIMTVSVSADAVISNITMYDMAGKAYKVPVNGTNMNKSKLNVAKGVYTVTVVTDKGTETKKIVVK